MKTLLYSITFFILSIPSISQPVTFNGNLSPASNVDDCNMSEKTTGRQLTDRVFVHKKTGKTMMTYKRLNDSSFVYTEYDESGKELRKGMLAQNNSKAMHYKIVKPDLAKDPELKLGLVKDSILYDNYFDRHGYWAEAAPGNITWMGNYDHELKTGIWKRVNSNDDQPGNEIDSIIVYQEGMPVNNANALSPATDLAPLLMGNWFADIDNSGRNYQVYHRKVALALESNYISFSAPDALQFNTKQGIIKGTWTLEHNELTIQMSGNVSKTGIVFLDGNTLIIRNLSR